MTVTAPANGATAGGSTGLGTPLPTRQRQPGYVALAVALVVGLGAVGAYLYDQAGAKTPVVVVVADIPAGHTITRADLSTVAVAGGITAIAGAHVDSVVGQTAAVELLPNTLLQRAMVTDADPLAAGQAEVGVAVRSGQVPADGVRPGDTVQVLALPGKDDTPASGPAPAATVLVAAARVFTARTDPSTAGGTLVTVIVPASASTTVAAASGAGLVALVKVPQP